MSALRTLAETWRAEAQRLRSRYGLEDMAKLCEAHACELLEAVQTNEDALVGPDVAARTSGYSKRRLRELEAEGRLQNHGRKGAPLYRAGELPRRTRGSAGGFDATATARRILGGRS